MKTFLIASTIVAAAFVAAPAASAKNIVVGFTTTRSMKNPASTIDPSLLPNGIPIPDLNAMLLVNVPDSAVEAIKRALTGRPGIRYVEEDQVAHMTFVPNDQQVGSQWGLAKIQAQSSWDTAMGLNTTIAVVDTGVDYNHPDLAGKVIKGHDFVSNDEDPMDQNDHGTHVAGIAAAVTNNAIGVAGVAPSAKILAVRVLDGTGNGELSAIANGITYAVDHGANVINLSMGGPTGATVLQDAVNYAASHNVVVSCAAGNDASMTLLIPAQYDSCTSVTATDQGDGRASFASGGTGLDLSAPGVGILSTIRNSQYDTWDGTSMSAPFVTGLAAVLASMGLDRTSIISTMTSTATDLGAPGYDTTFGFGRINAAAAVSGAGSGVTPPPPPPPTNATPTCTSATTAVRRGRAIGLTLQCIDANGDVLTYAIASSPSHGKLSSLDVSRGTVTYMPSRSFRGTDTFAFTARDAHVSASPATRTLMVS
ncbi:MAG: S8 family serine peptidase [Thermoleophilia bacterium]|nr:S8 family serine peptidase [Thermoleophilia bacterium]